MKKKLLITFSIVLGVILGYIETNILGATNIIQRSGIFPDGPDNELAIFAGFFIFPLFSFCNGCVVWWLVRALVPPINR